MQTRYAPRERCGKVGKGGDIRSADTWRFGRKSAIHLDGASLCSLFLVLPHPRTTLALAGPTSLFRHPSSCAGIHIGWHADLRPPVGEYVDNQVRLAGIVCLEMHSILMRAVHTGVHHEHTGLDIRAFSGL